MRARLWIVSVAAGMLALIGCNDVNPTAQAPEQNASLEPLTSIVQLGDSVASGEGTLYGYQWDSASQEWIDGNIDATWPPPYPDCHDSPDAYGNRVAVYFGATFHQFACTGATFTNGISAPETGLIEEYRPAQFGNWATQTDLNEDYDAAAAQVVLVTLGADDLQFVSIIEDCVKNAYENYWDIEALRCVDNNPGSTIQTDFLDALQMLEQHYGMLVSWIKERAQANNVPEPKVVFTNYPNPLPPDGTKCNDTNYLYPDQVKYLSSLVDQLNGIVVDTITGLNDPNVAVADISGAYTVQGTSHIWCSDDPWAYGLSIYSVTSPSSFESQAPFHPTPDGQESVAEHVIPVLRQWFAQAAPTDGEAPSSTAPEPTTTG